MTTEEKAKAYNEALERASKLRFQNPFDTVSQMMEHVFPELKESEDEKVKRIIHSISNKISFHLHDIFTEEEFQCFDAWSNAWLKKQDKSKWNENDEQYLLVCKNALRKYQVSDKWDANIISKWLEDKLKQGDRRP